MKLEQEILVNQYGQGVVNIKQLIYLFDLFKNQDKQLFLNDLLYLIMQSKPIDADIKEAIIESGLKPTYTPCVLLRKGVTIHNLKKIMELPNNELEKVVTLLLTLFKIAYRRKFEKEKNHPEKWWYWDLSDNKNVEKIRSMFECNNIN